MNDMKTVPTENSVETYLTSIDNMERQKDSRRLLALMQTITKEKPIMWGSSIVGFGKLHYKYATGREGDIMAVGFSARKQALVLYGLMYYEQNRNLTEELGTFTSGKGCLYIKKLDDVNLGVLSDMIKQAYRQRNNIVSE
jgi:hypothetical protein